MDILPINIKIPLNLDSINVTFVMNHFTTDTHMKRYQINYPDAKLYIQKVTPYNDWQAMDKTTRLLTSFTVSEDNLEGVKEIFEEAMSWFNSKNIDVLYGKNDDGMLMFNSDYSSLGAVFVNEAYSIKTALKLVPTVIEVGMNVMEPGVVLYINQMENAIILKVKELKKLANFILNFNFIPYIQFAMQCFHHSMITGSILTVEQVQDKLRSQKQYDTNFKF